MIPFCILVVLVICFGLAMVLLAGWHGWRIFARDTVTMLAIVAIWAGVVLHLFGYPHS